MTSPVWVISVCTWLPGRSFRDQKHGLFCPPDADVGCLQMQSSSKPVANAQTFKTLPFGQTGNLVYFQEISKLAVIAVIWALTGRPKSVIDCMTTASTFYPLTS